MRMAAGLASLVETPEALLASVREGGVRGPAPPGAEGGGRQPPAGDRPVGEPAPDRDAAEVETAKLRGRRRGVTCVSRIAELWGRLRMLLALGRVRSAGRLF